MNKTIITSGKKYIDIDAYAGIIAYKNLLVNLGQDVVGVSNAEYNESISQIIKDINISLDNYSKVANEEYIILDVSNADMFDDIVDVNRIVEIIDHHTGFEEYWKNKKEIKINIEFIGSICTIIFEKYEFYNKVNALSTDICKLLVAGILDNTLNLKASITTKRDIDAYNKLLKIGNIDEIWGNEYFLSCQQVIEKNLVLAVKNDLKIEYVNEMLPKIFGQLLVLNKDTILSRKNEMISILSEYGEEWMLNLISLSDGKSYILSTNDKTKGNLEKLFNLKFIDDIMILDKFMLRKEIMKKSRDYVN